MKINSLIFYPLILIPTLLSACEFNPDTVGFNKVEVHKSDTVRQKKGNFYVDLYTGIYQNKTFGLHPIFGARLGVRFNKKSGYYLASELRFGNSQNNYDVVVDDSLITTDYFLGEFIGLEYDRLLFSKKNHEVISTASIGYDWIRLPKVNDKTQRNGGFAFNIGLGYLFKFKKGAGPHIKFLYHYANINNKGGTKPNNNSFVCRITYILGYIE